MLPKMLKSPADCLNKNCNKLPGQSSSHVQSKEDQKRESMDSFQEKHFQGQTQLETGGDSASQDVDQSWVAADAVPDLQTKI